METWKNIWRNKTVKKRIIPRMLSSFDRADSLRDTSTRDQCFLF